LFPLFATGVVDRWQICHRCCWYRWQFANGVVDIGGKFDTVANLPPVSTIPVVLVAKFAAGVVDAGVAP
jgi:hypothetical protein